MKFAASLISTLVVLSTAAAIPAQDSPAASLTDSDRTLIAIQQICPVMGAELGSMGEPIKIRLGDQTAFLCCKACLSKKVNAEHWATIRANFAKAQGTCPIMGKPVTAEMETTVVEGRLIFVCCPPCIDKIQAEPKKAVQFIDQQYAAFCQDAGAVEAETAQIRAQRICPVSGEELGTMGTPIKVKAGEQVVYLCCQACQSRKLDPQHWATVQKNLAQAQQVCPVMGKPVTAEMESTIVAGRRIFVCCPPCIDKIQAKPAEYVAWLDQQLEKGKQK